MVGGGGEVSDTATQPPKQAVGRSLSERLGPAGQKPPQPLLPTNLPLIEARPDLLILGSSIHERLTAKRK
ncbi:hypothetical protein ABID65_005387 [Bradyrhizobium sp. S3.9.2]